MALDVGGAVLLAGAGKMGTALLEGWLSRGLSPTSLIIQEPAPSSAAAELALRHAIRIEPLVTSVAHPPAVIVVAVKPQVMEAVFAPLAKLAGPQTVVLSIAAGRSIASFERYLPADCGVVRAMPNTPASIGHAITGAVANAAATANQQASCDALLSAVGNVVWLDDESLLDAVTAISGSGPAYVFLLAECLAKAGMAAGLDADAATALARATVSGAGELLRRSPLDAAELRENVTSPGGTTAAALAVLMRDEGGLQALITEAVLAAQKRSRDLGT
jgi:pyrroline-5-carboxylate reductase